MENHDSLSIENETSAPKVSSATIRRDVLQLVNYSIPPAFGIKPILSCQNTWVMENIFPKTLFSSGDVYE